MKYMEGENIQIEAKSRYTTLEYVAVLEKPTNCYLSVWFFVVFSSQEN